MGGNLHGLRNLIVFDCVAHSLSPVLYTYILNASLPVNVPLKNSHFSTGASTFFVLTKQVCCFLFIQLYSEQVLPTE